MSVRVRLSPSPTGPLHIGTARTALFNMLFARQRGGEFILRIEDTDPVRSKREFEERMIDLLQWLGIRWDEGPDCGGGYGPYRQSERKEHYRKALEQLAARGSVYPCFCTVEMLEAERKAQEGRKEAPRYRGRCRAIPPLEAQRRMGAGERVVWRLKMPEVPRDIVWEDIIRDEVRFSSRELDDFIIAKSFDEVLYNFACAVDDAAMAITHVFRGEEHISNTPKQILIAESLGFPAMEYGHIPLILNPDRTKMSKRQGNVDLEYYRTAGYLPEALVNFLALLGWNPGDNREIFSLESLVSDFSIERVHKSGAVFSLSKLQWVNREYLRVLPLETLLERLEPHIPEPWRPDPRNQDVLELIRDRLTVLSDFWQMSEFFYVWPTDYPPQRLIWKLNNNETEEMRRKTRESLMALRLWLQAQTFAWGAIMLEAALKDWIAKEGRVVGEILWPMRVALSGREASPSPFDIAGILGKEETQKRLDGAIKKLTP